MQTKSKFYVTTPIYYPTAKPHLGSLYSTVIADVLARWHRLKNEHVFFLTGTDEHGQKIAQAAEKAGMSEQAFVDQFIDAYKTTWKAYGIEYTRFLRTTDQVHKDAVQAWLKKLIEQGDIYKDFYEGWYCVHCETFITEKNLFDLGAPRCTSCERETIKVKEQSYFFRLSAYQEKLLAFYKENPDFVTPKERLNEVLHFVQEGLKDLSISRTTITWGIPFPGDERHVTYVWADALNNYITAVGYPFDMTTFNYWWPADVHVLGKDILRFHAVYWPAFLMASGLPLPKQLVAHGWIKVNNQKMSKSFGNVVDPQDLLAAYGADAVRYYLMSQLSIAQDANFSAADMDEKINADLANNLGNLLNRTTQLAFKQNLSTIPACTLERDATKLLYEQGQAMIDEVSGFMDASMLHMAMARIMHYVSQVNAYLHTQEPWKCAHDKTAFEEIISAVFHALETIAVVLWPVMPHKMEELLQRLSKTFSLDDYTLDSLRHKKWHSSFVIQKGDILFKKIEPQETTTQQTPVQSEPSYISIDDFAKVELVVGTILECEIIEGSDKLLKLQVDCGVHGTRQILSGVRKHFSPDYLRNKQAVFVLNLKPRTMMGLQSQGMMLTVEAADGSLKLVSVDGTVPNGNRLK